MQHKLRTLFTGPEKELFRNVKRCISILDWEQVPKRPSFHFWS